MHQNSGSSLNTVMKNKFPERQTCINTLVAKNRACMEILIFTWKISDEREKRREKRKGRTRLSLSLPSLDLLFPYLPLSLSSPLVLPFLSNVYIPFPSLSFLFLFFSLPFSSLLLVLFGCHFFYCCMLFKFFLKIDTFKTIRLEIVVYFFSYTRP